MRLIKSTIATKLIRSLLGGSLLLIISSTALRFYYDYTSEMRDLSTRLHEVMETAVPVMSDNIWLADWEMVRLQAQGIKGLRAIRRVEVLVDDQKLIEIGPELPGGSAPLSSPLAYRYKNQDVLLGTLSLYSDEGMIRQQLLGEVVKELGFQLVVIFLISSMLFFLVHRLVGRHLTAMASQLGALGQENLKTQLVLDKKPADQVAMDEIDQVVFSFNEMQRSLQRTFEALRQSNEELVRENQERLLVEQKLRENRTMLRNILDTVPLGIFWKDQESVYQGCNRVFAQAAGLEDPQQILGKTDFDLPWPSKEAEAYLADDRAVIANRQGKQHIIEQRLKADGTKNWIDTSKVPLLDQQGQVNGVLGVFIDITEIKKMEEQIYLMLFSINAANEGVYLMDDSASFRFVNDGACRRLGYSREELLAMRVFDIDSVLLPEKWSEHWQYLQEHGSLTLESVHRTKSETDFPVEISISSVTYEGAHYLCSLSRDITERVSAEEEKSKLEAQLRQSQKMEAIGTLAGGIAHDFNNILAIILGYAELTLYETSELDPRRNQLGEIIKAGTRAKELVRQILDFSRKAEGIKQPLLLAPLVKETLKMVRASIPSTIAIEEQISAVDSTVLCDPIQLHQVIINLCTNAAHAMEEHGGTLSLALDYAQLGQEVAAGLGGEEGRYVRLTVTDNGCGMSQAIQERIFEPYFTTKGVGKGSGMGLAVVHGILRSHGGLVRVTSQEGHGSSFEVFLPAIEQPAREKVEEEKDFCPLGTERILVVDDEPAITDMVNQWLARLGYAVFTANNSREALAMVRENPSGFDLIVTDQTMPHMPGSQLAKEILAVRPDLPIILCTGYSSTLSEEKAREIGIRRYAYKPLQGNELARLVRQVLDGKEDGVGRVGDETG
ncbi:MAG: hypothetical protein BWK76_25470 [Desulfobulbaceae bacterium A2]|nr:MAG: hypothetical protein BWK76_25470 [Desulfobulbaceae bacterium A2]